MEGEETDPTAKLASPGFFSKSDECKHSQANLTLGFLLADSAGVGLLSPLGPSDLLKNKILLAI